MHSFKEYTSCNLISIHTHLKEFFILLVVFFKMLLPVAGQTKESYVKPGWILKIGVGLNRQLVKDKNFTTLLYSGQSAGYFSSLKYENNNSSHELELFYATGIKTTKVLPEQRLRAAYFNLDYINLYKIGALTNQFFSTKIGGAFDMLYAKRKFDNFINNNAAFEFAASLSAAIEGTYVFGNGLAGFSISDRLTVPFVSLVAQPSFGSSNADGSLSKNGNSFGDIFKENRLAGFSSFLRVKNYCSLEKVIGDKGKLSLNYTWDFYRLNGLRQVMQANHRIEIMYSFIF